MNLGIVGTVFVLILIAELPDKSMIATLVMGSRSNPLLVWIGASAAFIVHTVLAVVAGRLLLLLPHTTLEIIVSLLFLGGALYLLLVPESSQVEKGEQEAEREDSKNRGVQVVLTAFAVIAVGELGDITQLLTINLVAKYHAPLSVGVGAGLGCVADAALGAFGGKALLRVLPAAKIRLLGGLVFLGFAAATLYTLVA